ncbi:MAG: ABC transporter ATP-binding protein, partial [candidate division Zixibacteria bacterium]|nr:ABC transporter ATP-binding protein [candidate division Zixibacteria bacterium]
MSSEFYENEKITEEEKDISWKTAFSKLMPLLKDHLKMLIVCFALLISATLLSLYWPILLKQALDIDIKNSDFDALIKTVLIIGIIQGITIILQYIQRIRLEIVGQDIMLELKQKLFRHILSLDVSFFDKNPVGRLMARVESDTEALRMLFTNTVVLVLSDIILIAGIFGIMYYYSWRLASILLGIMPILFVLTVIFERVTSPRF